MGAMRIKARNARESTGSGAYRVDGPYQPREPEVQRQTPGSKNKPSKVADANGRGQMTYAFGFFGMQNDKGDIYANG
jgi:hypothetical protein